MTLKLRPYQEECLDEIEAKFQEGIHRQLVHLPTAAGKTVIFSNLIKKMGKKTLVLAHTCELLDQAKDKITMISPNLEIGLVKAGYKEYDRQIVISSIQSASQPETLEELKKQGFTLCVYDEAHRAGSTSARLVLSSLDFLNNPDQLLIGFSATPFRNDSKGLGEVFEKVVYHKSIKNLISLGYLCKPVGMKIKTDIDLSKVTTENGDFVTESLASVMDTPEMREVVVKACIEKAAGRKTVCFAVTVKHAQSLASDFNASGIPSEAIHGNMSSDQRVELLTRFRKGEIAVLTNCQILTEGWDCPEVDCILIAKPTQSKGLFTQMAGRGLRLFPNKKDCLILDFGSINHSLCSTALLEMDEEEIEDKRKHKSKMFELVKELPSNINKKLKSAILQFDPLGDQFIWEREGFNFCLRGIGDKTLKICQFQEGKFNVIFFIGNKPQIVARGLSFEYAFSTAETFAHEYRSQFVLNDAKAEWRRLPISDRQIKTFEAYGFRSGISDLTRGQASLIIASGILNKKSRQKTT